MSQTILKNQLARYLELINPEQTQAICKDIREVGLCYGLAVCHATMQRIGKLDWWEAALKQIANWDGKKHSLAKKMTLPNADQKNVTLAHIFERVLNYIVYNHAGTNRVWENITLIDADQSTFLHPKTPYYDVLCPDKKIRHIKDRKCAAGFFSADQIRRLLDEKMISGSICLIHSTYHTISLEYKDPYWILYDPNYPHDVQAKQTIYKNFTSKVLLVKEIQNILGSSLVIEYAIFEKLKLPSFPQWNKMVKISALQLLKECGFHLIVAKIPDRLPEIIHSAMTHKQAPEMVARALIALDEEQWCGLHKLIYFAPEQIPLVLTTAAKYINGISFIMQALSIVEPEEGYTVWQQLLTYAAAYLPDLLDLAESAPKQVEHLALALLTTSPTGESGWDLLNQYAPQHKKRVSNVLLDASKHISTDTLSALIKEFRLPTLKSNTASFFYVNNHKADKIVMGLTAELSRRQRVNLVRQY